MLLTAYMYALPHPPEIDFIGLRCNLGMWSFTSSPLISGTVQVKSFCFKAVVHTFALGH